LAELNVVNLSRRFGAAAPALDDVSFDVAEEEFVFLLGPSGAGKTTTLRIAAGLDRPSGGHVRLDGRDMTNVSPRDRNVAMVYDKHSLYPHLSVFENMAYPLRLRRMPDADLRARIGRTAEVLGISALLERQPGQLSGGQQQRVAIGRVLVRDAAIFLMDEPISHLDAKLRAHMRVEFKKLQRDFRATLLYVSHDQIEAMTMGDRIVVLDKGRVQQIGTPRDLYDCPANLFVAGFVGEPSMNLVPCTVEASATGPVARAGQIAVTLDPGALVRAGVSVTLGQALVLGIRPQRMTLADPSEAGQPNVEPGTAYAIETLGSETIVDIAAAGVVLRAWMRRAGQTGPLPRIGEALFFRIDPGAVHLFHADTGRALLHPARPA